MAFPDPEHASRAIEHMILGKTIMEANFLRDGSLQLVLRDGCNEHRAYYITAVASDTLVVQEVGHGCISPRLARGRR